MQIRNDSRFVVGEFLGIAEYAAVFSHYARNSLTREIVSFCPANN